MESHSCERGWKRKKSWLRSIKKRNTMKSQTSLLDRYYEKKYSGILLTFKSIDFLC